MPNVISIKLQKSFIEITLPHARFPVNLLHIFKTHFLKSPLVGCFCVEINEEVKNIMF